MDVHYAKLLTYILVTFLAHQLLYVMHAWIIIPIYYVSDYIFEGGFLR